MLYDFQDRKFFPRECPGEEFIQEVRDTESCLLRYNRREKSREVVCVDVHLTF